MRRGLLAVLLLVAGAQADEAGWQRVAEHDGIVIERRTDDGPSVHEVRATTRSALSPAAIMATLWKHDEYVQFVPYLKRLDVLRDEGDAKLVYEQLRVPLLKDRDLTLRVTRTFSPATGAYEVTSVAAPGEGPRESSAYVRVRTNVGRWRLEPTAEGGTAVTYVLRTDPGGLVPAWIINAAQKEVTAKFVRAMLDRAQQNNR